MGVSPAGHPDGHLEWMPPWAASDCGVMALRSVLQAHLRGGAADDDLRRAIGVVCRAARHAGLRAEQAIIAVKQTWYSLPEARARAVDARAALLDRAIRWTIDEFYAERD